MKIKKHIGSDIHGLFEQKLAESCVLNIPGIKLMYCPTVSSVKMLL